MDTRAACCILCGTGCAKQWNQSKLTHGSGMLANDYGRRNGMKRGQEDRELAM